jgi:superoxide dismutase, Fe-Mn family
MALYTLPELPYDYSALAPVEQLAEARDTDSWGCTNGLEKNLAFNLSGHVLHSIYWQNMTAPHEGGGEPLAQDGLGDLADAIIESFGTFEGFKAQLTKAAGTTQGSGWGVMAYEPLSGRLIVEQIYDHQGNVGQGSVPVLVFDAWEHAFYLQYKNQKVDFIEAMWQVVNWQDVARRYAAAKERGDAMLLPQH